MCMTTVIILSLMMVPQHGDFFPWKKTGSGPMTHAESLCREEKNSITCKILHVVKDVIEWRHSRKIATQQSSCLSEQAMTFKQLLSFSTIHITSATFFFGNKIFSPPKKQVVLELTFLNFSFWNVICLMSFSKLKKWQRERKQNLEECHLHWEILSWKSLKAM